MDLLSCTAALYVLLPGTLDLSYPAVLAAFMTAMGMGLLSHVPGGVGVFEAAMLLLLGPATQDMAATVGALLLFRAVYYLLPFALSAGVLAGTFLRSFARVGRMVRPLAPLVGAALTLTAGTILIFSGATPVEHKRLLMLGQWVPVGLVEASHLLGSLAGLVLLVVAHGLRQRLREAWGLALILSGVGVVLALIKGLEVGVSVLLLLNFLTLWPSRQAFDRKGSLLATRLTPGWWGGFVLILAASVWLMLFGYRHVQYRDDLWWQVELHAEASRSLRTMLATAVAALILGMRLLLRPASAQRPLPSSEELDQAQALLERFPGHAGWIALTGDKHLLWNAERTAFLMYGLQGRTWVCLGEPVGDPAAFRDLLWDFMEEVDANGGRPAFYQMGMQALVDVIDMGLHPFKLGESALVPLETFSLTGSKRSGLRSSCNRAERAGCRVEFVSGTEVPAYLDALDTISREWLDRHRTREKRFSLGFFDRTYLARTPLAIVRCNGQIVAFANLWSGTAGGTTSLDLMRQSVDAPSGTMDYLLVQIMKRAREQGYRFFDLGMAPLSGLPEHYLAGNWAQVARMVANHGERFYNFTGLRSYKEKFDPLWQPSYLVCRPRQLVAVLLDVGALIAGGAGGMVYK